jgi:hypothetical protein
MNGTKIKNSCGGQGCEVAEHIKRTGYDGDFSFSADIDNKRCVVSGKYTIGDLVMILEDVFGSDWPEVRVEANTVKTITWTTTIAN